MECSTRRQFLAGGIAGAAMTALPWRAAGQEAVEEWPRGTWRVPMDVQWQGAWLSWVAATTTCLRALGIDCDNVDVAGHSGYAFMITICEDEAADVSSPTSMHWDGLVPGLRALGRSTSCYHAPWTDQTDDAGNLTEAAVDQGLYCYSFVAGEIAAGRPCVLWGAYEPEFAAVVGVDEGHYEVRSFRQTLGQAEEPIHCLDFGNSLKTPGGMYALGFPTVADKHPIEGDMQAIVQARRLLSQPRWYESYAWGLEAYDVWAQALEENRVQEFGHAYSAQCWAEARRLGRDFTRRVADRREPAAEALTQAADGFGDAAASLGYLTTLFGFPPSGELQDETKRTEGVEAIRAAKAGDQKAAQALEAVEGVDWEG